MGKRILSGFIILFFIPFLCDAQVTESDSLRALIKNAKDDTLKVELLLALSKSYWNTVPESVIMSGLEALHLSEKLQYKKGIAFAYKTIGRGYFNQGTYVEALQNYEKSLALFDSIGDKNGMANINSQLGNIYYNQGDDTKALELFLKSLKISEEINDTLRMLTALNSVGSVYGKKPQTYSVAVNYFLKALPMTEALRDVKERNNSIAIITVNIGEMYLKTLEDTSQKSKNNPYIATLTDSALYFFGKSLKACEGSIDAAYTLNDMGRLYRDNNDYMNALRYHHEAFDIAKKYEAKNDMAISLVGLAQTYQQKGDTKNALTNFREAEILAEETQSTESLEEIYQGLSQAYSSLSDYKNAYKYQNRLLLIKKIIYNTESDKKLGTIQFTFDIEKKEAQIHLLTKDQELKAQEIKRQKIVRNSFMGGFAVVLLFAGIFFTQRNRISKEKKRSDELLLNILPEETAEELKATGTAKAKSFDLVTVMFTDFKNFTQASELLSAEQLVKEINYCYSEFDKIIMKHGIEKIKTIGDAYMCAGGLPVTNETHPVDLIKAGLEMQQFIEKNKKDRMAIDQPYFELRLGIHTGPVVAGIVGIKKFAYDIWGDTVNTASRMESSGEIGKVNISGTTHELVKDRFVCTYRGKVKAKNKGEIDMYFVEGIKN